MKKTCIAVLLAVVLCIGLSVSCFATEEIVRVVDEASLLTAAEYSELRQRLDDLSEAHGMDIVIVTVDSLGNQSAMAYADNYFDYNGYGMGADRSGLLLLISMEHQDLWISTSGYGIVAFTDAGLEYIIDQIKPDLSDHKFAEAFDTFADLCDSFIQQAKAGTPYDSHNLPKGKFEFGKTILIALGCGFVVAFIVTAVLKHQLKSIRAQSGAANYMKSGSLNVTVSRDIFLYRNVTKIPKPRDSGSSGGGSRTHRSSSGRSHGGRGGRF